MELIDRDKLKEFPIRRNHYDRKNGNALSVLWCGKSYRGDKYEWIRLELYVMLYKLFFG